VNDLFNDLDIALEQKSFSQKTSLHVVGSSALFLQTDLIRKTKDTDLLEIEILDEKLKSFLTKGFGKDSPYQQKNKIYIEFVSKAFFFLPQQPIFHKIQSGLKYIEMLMHLTTILSFPRKRESRTLCKHWIPACAGMTKKSKSFVIGVKCISIFFILLICLPLGLIIWFRVLSFSDQPLSLKR